MRRNCFGSVRFRVFFSQMSIRWSHFSAFFGVEILPLLALFVLHDVLSMSVMPH